MNWVLDYLSSPNIRYTDTSMMGTLLHFHGPHFWQAILILLDESCSPSYYQIEPTLLITIHTYHDELATTIE